jgi:LysM repeat protein
VSEMQPESGTQAPRSGGGKAAVWTKKAGPLPRWAWAALILGLVLAYLYYKHNSSSSTGASSDSSGSDTTTASQVPQFVNQTYTTVTPPAAPSTPTTGTTPTTSQIPGHHVVTANGKQTLQEIAQENGTTPADIIAFTKSHKTHISPTEKKFFAKGSGVVPKGIVLWVPEKQVTNVTGPGGGQSG